MASNRDTRVQAPWPQMAVLLALLIILLLLMLSSIHPTTIILPENVHRLQEIARYETEPGQGLHQIGLTDAGDTLIATTHYFNYLWRLVDGTQHVVDLRQSGGYIPLIALWNDRAVAAFLSWTGTLSLLDMASDQTLQRFDGISTYNEQDWAFNHDGSLLAFSNPEMLSVLDVASQERRFTIDAAEGRSFHYSYPAFSPDSSLLAAVYRDVSCDCEADLTVWDVTTGQQRALLGHFAGGSVWTFAFSRDNQLLVVGGNMVADTDFYAMIQLWNLDTGDELVRWRADGTSIDEILISPDKQLLAALDGSNVWLWQIDALIAGEPPLVEEYGDGNAQVFDGIAFSPDYRLFAYGTSDGEIRLVDTQNGALLTELQGHAGKINDLLFSADGRFLVSGGYDRTIRVWGLDDPGIVQSAIQQDVQPGPVMTPTLPGG